MMLDEFFFGNDREGVLLDLLSRIQLHGKCSTKDSSLRIYRKHVDEILRHTVEENGIDTKFANPYKTRIIAAEAKIKSDKL